MANLGSEKPSVEALRGMRERHQAKLEQAEREKEEHIQKMLLELEGLKSEREQNEQLLDEGRATLNYYLEMEKKEQLDEEDVKNLGDVKQLVSDLEDQKKIIDTSTADIKANPDVARKLREKEEAEFEIEKTEKIKQQAELKERLQKEFAALAENIRALGEKKYLLDKQIKDAKRAESEARKKVEEMAKAEGDALSSGSPLRRGDLSPYETQGGMERGGYGGYFDKLQRLRGGSGFWDFGPKRAVDNILSRKDLFDAVGEKHSAYLDLKKSLEPDYEKIVEEAKKLQEIYAKTRWEKTSGLNSNDDRALLRQFFSLLRSFADIERADPDNPGRILAGKYSSWGQAQADLRNSALYSVLYMIDSRVDF